MNKQHHNVIDYDYIVSNHDDNRDYITFVLKYPQKENKPIYIVLCKYIFRQHTI